MSQSKESSDNWLKRIVESMEGIQYGHVQITIHDGKIVQIDRLERRRYDRQEDSESTTKKNHK